MYTHIDLCVAAVRAYVPIYIYNTHILLYILYTIVVYIFTRVSMCVETLAVTSTHMATLFGLGSVQRSYLYIIYIYMCVCGENSFFSACGNRWPYVLNLV